MADWYSNYRMRTVMHLTYLCTPQNQQAAAAIRDFVFSYFLKLAIYQRVDVEVRAAEKKDSK